MSSAGCAGPGWGALPPARVSRPGWDLLPESRLDARRGLRWGLSFFLFLLPPAGEPNQNCHSRPVSQKGSDYKIPETDAGAARAGGSGQGQRHRRARTLAVAHTRLPDSPSLRAPRPPVPHHAHGRRSSRPAPPLAVVRAACVSRSREPPARIPDVGLWEVWGLDSRRCRRYVPPKVLCFVGCASGSLLLRSCGRLQVERGSPIGETGESENGCQKRPDLESNP